MHKINRRLSLDATCFILTLHGELEAGGKGAKWCKCRHQFLAAHVPAAAAAGRYVISRVNQVCMLQAASTATATASLQVCKSVIGVIESSVIDHWEFTASESVKHDDE